MTRPLQITPTFFHLLLCMADGAKHGYGMMQEIDERSGGALRLGPSSLYYSLSRLEDSGLIRETDLEDEDDAVHGNRRRYYTLTPEGRQRLQRELSALEHVLDHARAHSLIG